VTSDLTALKTLMDTGLPIVPVQADLDDQASLHTAVGEVVGRHGRLDVLVSNAGVGGDGRPVELIGEEAARTVLETNVLGNLRLLRAALPAMREQRSGVVIAMSSLSGRVPRPFIGLTSASKHALEALYETLAFEMAPFGVRVKIIEPGMFRTGVMRHTHAPPDRSSPYAQWTVPHEERIRAAIQYAPPPDLVGEAVLRAAQDRSPRLRYLVGSQAEQVVAGRDRDGWEAWRTSVLHTNGLDRPPNG
jgi:NAD(P)-dependent dehydrogenase (short-subunit alcohol dehydrogenase family)